MIVLFRPQATTTTPRVDEEGDSSHVHPRDASDVAAKVNVTHPIALPVNSAVIDAPGSVKSEKHINIYYRDGQHLDNCLVANSAKRVRMYALYTGIVYV